MVFGSKFAGVTSAGQFGLVWQSTAWCLVILFHGTHPLFMQADQGYRLSHFESSSRYRTAGLRRPQGYGRHSQTDMSHCNATFTHDRASHYKRVSVIYSANPGGSWFKPSRYLSLATFASWPNSDSSSISDFYSHSPDQLYPLTNYLSIHPHTTTLLSLPRSLYWLCPIICNAPLMWTHPCAFPNYTLLSIPLNRLPYSLQYTTPHTPHEHVAICWQIETRPEILTTKWSISKAFVRCCSISKHFPFFASVKGNDDGCH